MAKLKHERICQVNRNHKYSYCPFCAEYSHLPGWMMGFCSENCRTIYNIVMDYKVGLLTINAARDELLKCDLTEKDQFENYIKVPVESILNSGNETTETPKVEEPTPVVEETPVAEESIAPTEEANVGKGNDEPLSVSEELKKHSNNRHKFNKKN